MTVVLAAEVAARRATLRVDDDLLWRSSGKQLPLNSEVRLDPDSPDDGGSAAFLHRLAAFDRERQATDARA